jgi:glycosyltransferase involved in cell wall biosynthesis
MSDSKNVRPAVLIVSSCASHPPNTGNQRRLLTLAETLKSLGWRPVLLYTDFLAGDVAAMRQWWDGDFHFLPYRPGSWHWRLKRIARKAFARWPRLRTLPLKRSARTNETTLPLRSVDDYYEPALDDRIDELHSVYQFDAVVCEYVMMSRALLRFGKPVRRLLDTVEIFSLGDASRNAPSAKIWVRVSPEEELRGLQRADVVVAIQDHDAKTFRDAGLTRVVTFGHPVALAPEALPVPGGTKPQLLFVAAGHPFDVDGLWWFWREVYPLLAAWLPPDQVVVAGGIADALVERPPFRFLGRVPDLEPVYRSARVVMAPLREGTGLKIKVVEALGQGKALVATTFGAKGVEQADGSALKLADSPAAFAEAIELLMRNDEQCLRFMCGARDFARQWNERQRKSLEDALQGPTKGI